MKKAVEYSSKIALKKNALRVKVASVKLPPCIKYVAVKSVSFINCALWA